MSFPIFEILLFALGLTGIVFIAIILFLDIPLKEEPLALPRKHGVFTYR